jgi:hypothetical protein
MQAMLSLDNAGWGNGFRGCIWRAGWSSLTGCMKGVGMCSFWKMLEKVHGAGVGS